MQSKKRGEARIVLLVLGGFVFGLLCGGYFYYRQTRIKATPEVETMPATFLSDSTMAILQRLNSPVDLKIYSPADPAALPERVGAFDKRVQQLLKEYVRVSDGKIRLVQSDPIADPSAKAAAGAEGVLPFAGNNGEVCYLGITVAQNGRRITIPQLSPEWESALESDVSRAIARVTTSATTPAAAVAQVTATPAPLDPVISEELVRTIPDLQSRSFDDSAKILREAALKEFTATIHEMQTKVQTAEKQLADSQGRNSPDEQQAAMKQLQQIQSEQTEKLKAITAQLQARITVLERLKGVNRSTPK
jgi:hypothetical protein